MHYNASFLWKVHINIDWMFSEMHHAEMLKDYKTAENIFILRENAVCMLALFDKADLNEF